jgi:hypothetical protein
VVGSNTFTQKVSITKPEREWSRSKPNATVETSNDGRFRFTEHAGPAIAGIEQPKSDSGDGESTKHYKTLRAANGKKYRQVKPYLRGDVWNIVSTKSSLGGSVRGRKYEALAKREAARINRAERERVNDTTGRLY